MDIQRLAANEAFFLDVFGFQITQGPPSPSGQQQFATTPTAKVYLSTASSAEVPNQTISFTTGNPGMTSNLSLPEAGHGGFDNDHWIFSDGNEMTLQLTLDNPVAVEFTMTIAAETTSKGAATNQLSISVNGHEIVNGYKDQNASWHDVSWTIPQNMLNAGANTIKVMMHVSNDAYFWLQAITVSSQNVPISAYYYWQEVFSGYALPPGQESKTVSIQTGTDKTDTQAYSFAEMVGVEVQTKEGVPFANVSMKLSASFTATQSTTHSITISESNTEQYQVTITPTQGPVTFQFWQVCIEFDANGQSIDQLLDAPIIQTEYPASTATQPTLQVVSRSTS